MSRRVKRLERKLKLELRRGGIRPVDKLMIIYDGSVRGKVLTYALWRVEKEYPQVDLAVLTDPLIEISKEDISFVEGMGFKVVVPSVKNPPLKSLTAYYLFRRAILERYRKAEGYFKSILDITLDEYSCIALRALVTGNLSPLRNLLKPPLIAPLIKVKLSELISYFKVSNLPGRKVVRFGPLDDLDIACWRTLNEISSAKMDLGYSMLKTLRKLTE